MKATYQPRDKENIFNYLRHSIGKDFEFKPADTICGVKKFWPDDKNFPSSTPVSEHDLVFKEEAVDEKQAKMDQCKKQGNSFVAAGIVELNIFLNCGDCPYLDECHVPQLLLIGE